MSIINSQPRIGAAGQSTGFKIERSLRFNSADTANLNRTFSSSGNRKTWTWSGWVKRALIESEGTLFSGSPNASNYSSFSIGRSSGNRYIRFFNVSTTLNLDVITSSVYRDASAWYHIVLAVDTTQATDSNRVKIYVNGVQVTAFGTATYPSQNTDLVINQNCSHTIGKDADVAGGYLDAYITECYFIDGSAKTPSDFGETDTDTGVWKPKAYSGSYGTNGFYLKFADNSGTTSTTLGKDSSGNGNNWTPTGFVVSPTTSAGNDSLVDTPTPYGTDTGAGGEVRGNYATWNPLDKNSNGSLVNGNLDNSNGSANNANVRSTFALPSSGKWYAELRVNSATSGTVALSFGFATSTADLTDSVDKTGKYSIYGAGSGYIFSQTSTITSGLGAFSSGDILQIAYDGATGKAWLGKNNTWYNSTGGTTGDPGAGTNQTFTLSGEFFIYSYYYNVSGSLNCGQRPFAYTAPSGFKALCTQNLPTPTIGATASTQAGKYFTPVIYTGDGTTPRSITVGFQPDFVWHKPRTTTGDHQLFDAVRGAGKALYTNGTFAEYDYGTGSTSPFISFDSNGYTIGTGANSNTVPYVAWNWKANGAGSTNNAGSIQSTVSANTTAGFSIVTYTGNGTVGATVGHGLGVTPAMLIVKRRDATSANRWAVQHTSLAADQLLALNTTAAVSTESAGAGSTFNVTKAGSSVFTLGNYADSNANTGTYVAYVFAPVAGYSAFGSYTGNGSTDGPMIYTGFRPRYILFKNSSAASGWNIFDTARDTYNAADKYLGAQTSAAESSGTAVVDILSNGFKVRNSWTDVNGSGNTIVYAAFAEVPQKFSLAR